MNGLSPLNNYLIDELDSFVAGWKGKWEIEKAAPTIEDPPIVLNFFVLLGEKLAAVEDQLAAHEEARKKAKRTRGCGRRR